MVRLQKTSSLRWLGCVDRAASQLMPDWGGSCRYRLDQRRLRTADVSNPALPRRSTPSACPPSRCAAAWSRPCAAHLQASTTGDDTGGIFSLFFRASARCVVAVASGGWSLQGVGGAYSIAPPGWSPGWGVERHVGLLEHLRSAVDLGLGRCVGRIIARTMRNTRTQPYAAPGLRVLPNDACRLPGLVPGLSWSKAYATNIWLRHSQSGPDSTLISLAFSLATTQRITA
jgi:hypothetical protein